jgi:hypothetical protein
MRIGEKKRDLKIFFVDKTDKILVKTKNTCLIIFNDELNCQILTIFMKPRSIHVETFRE